MTKRFEMSIMGELKFFLGFQIKQLKEGTFISQTKYTVVEPPKLYGPYAPVIVSTTSDGYACVPYNLKSLSGVLGKLESSTIYNSHRINKGVTTTLQHLIQNLHQSAEE
jgi:hypothetical protein